MKTKQCPQCREELPADCFRRGGRSCVWCAWSDMRKRAKARYRDKRKLSAKRLAISIDDFVRWYESQQDRCEYCGLTFAELRSLRIRRKGGYSVSWDIDRRDSALPYQVDNLALSCFVCNMAKGDMLSYEEALLVGRAIRDIWRARLSALPNKRLQPTASAVSSR